MQEILMDQVVFTTVTMVKSAIASTTLTFFGVIQMAVGGVRPDEVLITAGGTGMLFYTGWRVWKDNRATDLVRSTLEKQIESVTKDRDYWRALALKQRDIE
jgi:hypothetical protein